KLLGEYIAWRAVLILPRVSMRATRYNPIGCKHRWWRSTVRRYRVIALLVLSAIAAACAPAAPGVSRSGAEPGAPGNTEVPSRTLILATKVEPTTLAPRALTSTGSSPTAPVMGMFSAWLVVVVCHNGRRA